MTEPGRENNWTPKIDADRLFRHGLDQGKSSYTVLNSPIMQQAMSSEFTTRANSYVRSKPMPLIVTRTPNRGNKQMGVS